MEIGEHGAGSPELETRGDEEVGLRPGGIAFYGPHAGGSYRQHSRSRAHRVGCFLRHHEALRMQPNFFEDFGMQRLERAEPNMQRHPRDGRTRGPASLQNFWSEMESGSRRRD